MSLNCAELRWKKSWNIPEFFLLCDCGLIQLRWQIHRNYRIWIYRQIFVSWLNEHTLILWRNRLFVNRCKSFRYHWIFSRELWKIVYDNVYWCLQWFTDMISHLNSLHFTHSGDILSFDCVGKNFGRAVFFNWTFFVLCISFLSKWSSHNK